LFCGCDYLAEISEHWGQTGETASLADLNKRSQIWKLPMKLVGNGPELQRLKTLLLPVSSLQSTRGRFTCEKISTGTFPPGR
jgi:hypothetical protein